MTDEQIKQKAENVYMRCFDDDFKYKGVLHALEICAGETATEATKELQEKNNQLEELEKDRDYYSDALDKQIEATLKIMKQLNEAKELLKRWVELYKPNYKFVLPTPIQVDTEQFLKEISE
jgi:uncharacterized protein (DUF1015 family)